MDQREYGVWQRVQSVPEQSQTGEELYRLESYSLGALEDYRSLAAGCRGMEASWAAALQKGERENLMCLRGLFLLSTGRAPACREGAPGVGRFRDGYDLYCRALEQLRLYTACSARPGLGAVFGEMAKRQASQCEILVRILGLTGGVKTG